MNKINKVNNESEYCGGKIYYFQKPFCDFTKIKINNFESLKLYFMDFYIYFIF